MATTAYFPDIQTPRSIQMEDLDEVVVASFQAGYKQTRAANTRINQRFTAGYRIKQDDMLDLKEFYRQRGGRAETFFWQFPLGVAGFGGFGGFGSTEDETGFENHPDAVGYGFGEGPYFRVRFSDRPKYTHVANVRDDHYYDVVIKLDEEY